MALTPASEGQGFTVWFLPASNGPERVSVTDARPAAGMAASPASPVTVKCSAHGPQAEGVSRLTPAHPAPL